MKAFDLQRMAFDKVPPEFLGEVALRSLYTFVLVFLFLKITGRRGVRQMSLFEVLIILSQREPLFVRVVNKRAVSDSVA